MTINAAHAVGVGEQAGSLEPGKQADLVVWRAGQRHRAPVLGRREPRATVVVKRGRVVHRRGG